jgi:mitochondrial splicing suppressor protein 51
MSFKCAHCDQTTGSGGQPLKRCAKCQTTRYCSRECQKSDFKQHKKQCAGLANIRATTSGNPKPSVDSSTAIKNLDTPIAKPFTALMERKWLHDRCEKDVFKLLIDAHRLRMNDEYTL